MATFEEFQRMSRTVSNWGRWGDDDEIGTLNFITEDKIREAASMVKQGKVLSLGSAFDTQGPQGAAAPRRLFST